MKNYKDKNIKTYERIEGSNFEDIDREKFIRKIVKLAGKMGWRYSQNELIGKSFCVTDGSRDGSPDSPERESVTIEFIWKSSKHK